MLQTLSFESSLTNMKRYRFDMRTEGGKKQSPQAKMRSMLVTGSGQRMDTRLASRTENSRNSIMCAMPLTGVQSNSPPDSDAAPDPIYKLQHIQHSIPMYCIKQPKASPAIC